MTIRLNVKDIQDLLAATPVRHRPTAWTGPLVIERLIEAFRTLDRLPGRIGPARLTSRLGPFAPLAQLESPADPEAAKAGLYRTWARGTPTPRDIARMERAIEWPMKYLNDDSEGGKALLAFTLSKARGRRLDGLPQLLLMTQAEFDASRRRGAYALAVALSRDCIAVD